MSPPKTFLILKYALFCALDFVLFARYIYLFSYDFSIRALSCFYTAYLHTPFTPAKIHQSLFKLLYISGSCYITVTIRYPLLCFYSIYPGDYTETQNLRQIFVIEIYVHTNILLLSCRGYKVQFYTVDKYKSIHT